MRGPIIDCSRSTIRLVATNTIDNVRIVPCTPARQLMIALLNRKPLPGHVNSVSTSI
jgi:hypothetical protein